MRIRELLENKVFDEKDFVEQSNDKREINYDLAEDLMHFMNQNDDVYRRHLFPVIANLIDGHKKNRVPEAHVFKPAVEKSYQLYIKKFPIRELPEDIDTGLCRQVCKKIHEEVRQHISDGKYKD